MSRRWLAALRGVVVMSLFGLQQLQIIGIFSCGYIYSSENLEYLFSSCAVPHSLLLGEVAFV